MYLLLPTINTVFVLELPGVPSPGTPAYEAFWLSFWSALYSGIISSVITGLIVGIVVWQLQIQAEKRAETRKAKDRLNTLHQDLIRLSGRHSVTTIDSPSTAISSSVYEVITHINSAPLGEWQQRLTKKYPSIKEMLALTDTYRSFIDSADSLSIVLNQAIRHRNHNYQLEKEFDSAFLRYFIGRILGYSHEEVLPLLGIATNVWEGMIDLPDDHFVDELLSHPNLSQSVSVYVEKREKLLTHFQKVLSLLKAERNIRPAR